MTMMPPPPRRRSPTAVDDEGDSVPLFSTPSKANSAVVKRATTKEYSSRETGVRLRRPSSRIAAASPTPRTPSSPLAESTLSVPCGDSRRRGRSVALVPSSPPPQGRPKWYVFAFGTVTVPAEMELKSIRRRLRQRSLRTEAAAGSGRWSWFSSLSCMEDVDVVEPRVVIRP